MRWAIISIIMLAGCAEKESAKLERQYAMMKEAGASSAELCVKGRAIAEALLREEDRDKYDLKRIEAEIQCNAVALDRLHRD